MRITYADLSSVMRGDIPE